MLKHLNNSFLYNMTNDGKYCKKKKKNFLQTETDTGLEKEFMVMVGGREGVRIRLGV